MFAYLRQDGYRVHTSGETMIAHYF